MIPPAVKNLIDHGIEQVMERLDRVNSDLVKPDDFPAEAYALITRAPDPQAVIGQLPDGLLIKLNAYLGNLPNSGFPAVVRAAVTVECASRFLKAGGGQ